MPLPSGRALFTNPAFTGFVAMRGSRVWAGTLKAIMMLFLPSVPCVMNGGASGDTAVPIEDETRVDPFVTEEGAFSSGADGEGAATAETHVATECHEAEAGRRASGDDSALENSTASFEASRAAALVEPWQADASRVFESADAEEAERNVAAPRALGIRLRKAGQVFFFPDEEHTVRIGSKVVVSFEQGPALGEVDSIVCGETAARLGGDAAHANGRVVGLATARDIALHAENSILAAEAAAFCKTCIRQRTLDMKLVDVEVLHDRSKIIFFFTAPSRIDFRELVKDLVRNYRTRIELRQIGVRHETQMIGGLGNCGMVCCCHRYLRKFAPVTIKMAKEQNLFLNPAKLSGMCGRLLCCLSFEQSNYEEFNRRCPKLGKKYTTSKGTGKVLRANMFTRSIVVFFDAGEEVELTLEEWDGLEPCRMDAHAQEQHPVAPDRGATGQGGAAGKRQRRADGQEDSPAPWSSSAFGEDDAIVPPQENDEADSAQTQTPGRAGRRSGRPAGQGARPRKRRKS